MLFRYLSKLVTFCHSGLSCMSFDRLGIAWASSWWHVIFSSLMVHRERGRSQDHICFATDHACTAHPVALWALPLTLHRNLCSAVFPSVTMQCELCSSASSLNIQVLPPPLQSESGDTCSRKTRESWTQDRVCHLRSLISKVPCCLLPFLLPLVEILLGETINLEGWWLCHLFWRCGGTLLAL